MPIRPIDRQASVAQRWSGALVKRIVKVRVLPPALAWAAVSVMTARHSLRLLTPAPEAGTRPALENLPRIE